MFTNFGLTEMKFFVKFFYRNKKTITIEALIIKVSIEQHFFDQNLFILVSKNF